MAKLIGRNRQGFANSSVTKEGTVDKKFLSSVWSLKDQNKKISKGEWIRNDADTSVDGKGRTIKGAGLQVFGHRYFTSPNIAGSGGNEITTPTHKYHVFTSPGTFNMTGAQGQVEYLVVGGGGHGGPGSGYNNNRLGGGGGGGGVRQGFLDSLTPGSYPITVGDGGGTNSPTWSPSAAFSPSYNGGPSSFATVTAAGGGAGGTRRPSGSTSGEDGGSGGGAGYGRTDYGSGNTPPTTPTQGNPGGSGSEHPSGSYIAGGGGGAGGAGVNGQGGGHGGLGSFFPQFAGPIIQPAINAGGRVNGVPAGDMITAIGPAGFYGAGGGGATRAEGGVSHPLRRGGGGPTGASNLPYDVNGRSGVSHGALNFGGNPGPSGFAGFGGGHGGGGGGDQAGNEGGNGIVIIRYET